MNQRWKELAAVFLMGVMMPGLALRLTGLILPGQARVEPPEGTAVPSPPTEAPGPGAPAAQIPVLMRDGTVRLMELEEYLVGVVLAEMPASFEPEALKAQAVAARTFTLRCCTVLDKHPGGAVCADHTCCQAYMAEGDYLAGGGSRKETEKIRAAVAATAGEVLTYDGEMIEAVYFSCSGGRTEDAAAVWGGDIPYLQSVPSPGEEDAGPYSRTVFFTVRELETLLGRSLTGTPKSWLGAAAYTRGGGVATMVLAGKSYTGVQLRTLLKLDSTAFTVEPGSDGLSITTSGKGHRVGMSQYGAEAMAVGGSSYREILAYYYPGTVIEQISGQQQTGDGGRLDGVP